MKLKLNKGGLKLSAAYTVFLVLMMALSFTGGDPKGQAFLRFLAFAPAFLILYFLRLLGIPHAWALNLWTFLGLSLLTTYCIGWAVSAAGNFVRWLPGSEDEPPK